MRAGRPASAPDGRRLLAAKAVRAGARRLLQRILEPRRLCDEGPVPPRAPLRRRPFAPAAARAAADAGLVGGVRLRLFLFARKKL